MSQIMSSMFISLFLIITVVVAVVFSSSSPFISAQTDPNNNDQQSSKDSKIEKYLLEKNITNLRAGLPREVASPLYTTASVMTVLSGLFVSGAASTVAFSAARGLALFSVSSCSSLSLASENEPLPPPFQPPFRVTHINGDSINFYSNNKPMFPASFLPSVGIGSSSDSPQYYNRAAIVSFLVIFVVVGLVVLYRYKKEKEQFVKKEERLKNKLIRRKEITEERERILQLRQEWDEKLLKERQEVLDQKRAIGTLTEEDLAYEEEVLKKSEPKCPYPEPPKVPKAQAQLVPPSPPIPLVLRIVAPPFLGFWALAAGGVSMTEDIGDLILALFPGLVFCGLALWCFTKLSNAFVNPELPGKKKKKKAMMSPEESHNHEIRMSIMTDKMVRLVPSAVIPQDVQEEYIRKQRKKNKNNKNNSNSGLDQNLLLSSHHRNNNNNHNHQNPSSSSSIKMPKNGRRNNNQKNNQNNNYNSYHDPTTISDLGLQLEDEEDIEYDDEDPERRHNNTRNNNNNTAEDFTPSQRACLNMMSPTGRWLFIGDFVWDAPIHSVPNRSLLRSMQPLLDGANGPWQDVNIKTFQRGPVQQTVFQRFASYHFFLAFTITLVCCFMTGYSQGVDNQMPYCQNAKIVSSVFGLVSFALQLVLKPNFVPAKHFIMLGMELLLAVSSLVTLSGTLTIQVDDNRATSEYPAVVVVEIISLVAAILGPLLMCCINLVILWKLHKGKITVVSRFVAKIQMMKQEKRENGELEDDSSSDDDDVALARLGKQRGFNNNNNNNYENGDDDYDEYGGGRGQNNNYNQQAYYDHFGNYHPAGNNTDDEDRSETTTNNNNNVESIGQQIAALFDPNRLTRNRKATQPDWSNFEEQLDDVLLSTRHANNMNIVEDLKKQKKMRSHVVSEPVTFNYLHEMLDASLRVPASPKTNKSGDKKNAAEQEGAAAASGSGGFFSPRSNNNNNNKKKGQSSSFFENDMTKSGVVYIPPGMENDNIDDDDDDDLLLGGNNNNCNIKSRGFTSNDHSKNNFDDSTVEAPRNNDDDNDDDTESEDSDEVKHQMRFDRKQARKKWKQVQAAIRITKGTNFFIDNNNDEVLRLAEEEKKIRQNNTNKNSNNLSANISKEGFKLNDSSDENVITSEQKQKQDNSTISGAAGDDLASPSFGLCPEASMITNAATALKSPYPKQQGPFGLTKKQVTEMSGVFHPPGDHDEQDTEDTEEDDRAAGALFFDEEEEAEEEYEEEIEEEEEEEATEDDQSALGVKQYVDPFLRNVIQSRHKVHGWMRETTQKKPDEHKRENEERRRKEEEERIAISLADGADLLFTPERRKQYVDRAVPRPGESKVQMWLRWMEEEEEEERRLQQKREDESGIAPLSRLDEALGKRDKTKFPSAPTKVKFDTKMSREEKRKQEQKEKIKDMLRHLSPEEREVKLRELLSYDEMDKIVSPRRKDYIRMQAREENRLLSNNKNPTISNVRDLTDAQLEQLLVAPSVAAAKKQQQAGDEQQENEKSTQKKQKQQQRKLEKEESAAARLTKPEATINITAPIDADFDRLLTPRVERRRMAKQKQQQKEQEEQEEQRKREHLEAAEQLKQQQQQRTSSSPFANSSSDILPSSSDSRTNSSLTDSDAARQRRLQLLKLKRNQQQQQQNQQQENKKPEAEEATNNNKKETDTSLIVNNQKSPTTSSSEDLPVQPKAATTATAPPEVPFKDRILKIHNNLRQRHSAPPLSWNDDLAANAATCAYDSWGKGEMIHSHNSNGAEGQNIFVVSNSKSMNPELAVQSWYDESKDPGYDFSSSFTRMNGAEGTGHFTQVIWKSSVSIGAALSPCGKYLVANYSPAGNVKGKYFLNVQKPGDRF